MPIFDRLVRFQQAATFSSFDAATDAPNLFQFGKKNLIYGFNGCGKTTLSRVFALLGDGTAPAALPTTAKFEFRLDDGTVVSSNRNSNVLSGRVIVYNEDFIEANFNWQQGTAEPVQLGAGLIADVKRLEELQGAVAKADFEQQTSAVDRRRAASALEEFCREMARNIEQTTRLQARSFQAPQLKRAYVDATIDPSSQLNSDDYEAAIATIDQTEPPRKLRRPPTELPDFRNLASSELRHLLESTAQQSPLAGFAGHETERVWLQHGYNYHKKHDLKACLLCGSGFTRDQYAALAAYFSDAVNEIARRTQTGLELLTAYEGAVDAIRQGIPVAEDAAPQLRAAFREARSALLALLDHTSYFVDPIRQALVSKAGAPSSVIAFDDGLSAQRSEWFTALQRALAALMAIISKQDAIADQFTAEQDRQRAAVRGHLLAQSKAKYDELVADDAAKDTALRTANDVLAKLKRELSDLQAKMRDHALAAEPINAAIANFLRHKQILIEPVEKGYVLKRSDGTHVVKLSEGEKTAVTFCYFIASLQADNRKKQDLIVVVDDPISSLDTRALNYMAALTKSELDGVGQLFVLTHNLPFMAEMRKWIAPASLMRRASEAKRKTPPEVVPIPLYQIHVRQTPDGRARTALLDNMHSLVRDYESEYHFLYSVLHTFAAQENPTAGPIYLLPNAIRKVLETFLSFKVPGMQNLSAGLQGIQGKVSNKVDLKAVERFAETESHGLSLAALVEPSQKAIEEAHIAANALLAMIEQVDADHAEAMRRLSTDYPALG